MAVNAESSSSPVYTVVWDIDGVLCGKTCRSVQEANFFYQKGHVVHAVATHYIFPGVAEMFQRLDQERDVRFAFFSNGQDERNEKLCPQILTRALGEERASEVLNDIKICSRSDTHRKEASEATYGLSYGNKGKDLRKALAEDATLHNAVLIDDDSSYVAIGQGSNLLKVRETKITNFTDLIGDALLWNGEGRYITEVIVSESPRDLDAFPGEANLPEIAQGLKQLAEI